jgi:hypothetical protein
MDEFMFPHEKQHWLTDFSFEDVDSSTSVRLRVGPSLLGCCLIFIDGGRQKEKENKFCCIFGVIKIVD